MQTETAVAPRVLSQFRDGQDPRKPLLASSVSDEQSALMQQAFKRSGGLASSGDLALFLRSHCDQPISVLARWIVRRELLSFVWRSQTLIPMFQFELGRRSIRAGMVATITELMGGFDEVESLLWFARPNIWLGDVAPADLVATDMHAVHQAARADRFISQG